MLLVDYTSRLLREGKNAEQALGALTGVDANKQRRQAAIVDAKGRPATFTGAGCVAWAGGKTGKGWAAQGNILTGENVVKVMGEAFEKARTSGEGELAEWLVAALAAGDAAGGDKRGRQSAALLVVRDKGGYAGGNDRYVDLRVDDHKSPVIELRRILALHRTVFRRR